MTAKNFKVTFDVQARVVPIANPTHNACAAELRGVFVAVFGHDRSKWPEWADDEIYRLAGRLSAEALRFHPLRRMTGPCLCATFSPAKGSGFDDGYTGPEHCSECGGVDRRVWRAAEYRPGRCSATVRSGSVSFPLCGNPLPCAGHP